MEAAKTGNVESLQKHLNSRAYKQEWLAARDIDDKTPLYWASYHNHPAVIKMLVDAGADVNLIAGKWTPLAAASYFGAGRAVEALLAAGADVNPGVGDLPLTCAVRGGYSKIIERLLDAGADVNARDSHHGSALHYAAEGRELRIAEQLLRAGANIDARDNAQRTPLHNATASKNLPMVDHLLRRGADATLRDKKNQTPEEIAKEAKQIDILRLIRRSLGVPEVDGEGSERWVIIGSQSIALIGTYPELRRTLTQVFNFATRERTYISEHLETKAETVFAPTPFDDIGDKALREAFDRFTALGGRADAANVFGRMWKPPRPPLDFSD